MVLFNKKNILFIFIEKYKCKNSIENNNEYLPNQIIDYYLNETFLSSFFQEIVIDISGFNQKYQLLINEYYITISNILFKEIDLYFNEVDINGLLHPKRNILNLMIYF